MTGKGKSIRIRLLFPLLLIMFLQSLLFFSMIFNGGIAKTLRSNAIDILNDNTENGKLILEQELYRWMSVSKEDNGIAAGIEQVIEEEGKQSQDIAADTQLNKAIIDSMTPGLISMLRRSYATGAFLILDGPAAENSPASVQAGIYLRDLEPNSFSIDNADLLLERGLPSISKNHGIPLDTGWQLGFDLSGDPEKAPYYSKPFESAVDNHAEKGEEVNFSYLGRPIRLNAHDDMKVITYSFPVILKDGTIVGVAGVDMAADDLLPLINSQRLASTDKGIYLLGVRIRGEQKIKLAATGNSSYKTFFGDQETVNYTEADQDNIYEILSKNEGTWYGSVQKLNIYDTNTPFETDEWVLLGMLPKNEVLQIYEQMRSILAVSLIITFLLSIAGVFFTGKVVTDPIERLIKELRSKKDDSQLSLQKVYINEIDELTNAIEKLSANVAESAFKISSILDHANVLVGVYEYKMGESAVFCSRSLYEVLRWGEQKSAYTYLDLQDFIDKMKIFKGYESEEDGIYKLEGEPERWVKLICVKSEASQELGVLTDVTSDVLERKKLEKERNYDSLTDIYNRRAFREEVTHMITRDKPEIAAVVMWDLDNLKYINDTYGHDGGDRYICQFAGCLKKLQEKGGIVSRYSGDEFATILYGGGKDVIRQRLSEYMIDLQSQILDIEQSYRIPLRVSGGLAWYPDDAKTFDALMTYADFAMYTVKHSVKGIILEFDQEEYKNRSYMLSGREELNNLLETRKTVFAFQPIVTSKGELYGYELLMRPHLKTLKGIEQVFNLAKEQAKLGQLESLTWLSSLHAIDAICKKNKVGKDVKFFINSISSAILSDEDIARIELQYKDYLGSLVLEITEGEPIDHGYLEQKLDTLKRWNAMIAIDDFGAGYNSESILLAIAPNIVKIDRNLVQNIDQDKNRQVLLENLMIYTKRLGIKVLGEGVETQEELETLLRFGVELFQGFYIARPEVDLRPIDPYITEKILSLSQEQTLSNNTGIINNGML